MLMNNNEWCVGNSSLGASPGRSFILFVLTVADSEKARFRSADVVLVPGAFKLQPFKLQCYTFQNPVRFADCFELIPSKYSWEEIRCVVGAP